MQVATESGYNRSKQRRHRIGQRRHARLLFASMMGWITADIRVSGGNVSR